MTMSKSSININDYVPSSATAETIRNAASKSAKKWTDMLARGVDGAFPLPTKGLAAAISLISVASLADLELKRQNKKRAEKQERKQEKELEIKREKLLQDRSMGMGMPPEHVGLVQEMFGRRIGHTSSWGGKRY